MLTEEEKIRRAKELAHQLILQIGQDEIMNRVIRNELHKNFLAKGEK